MSESVFLDKGLPKIFGEQKLTIQHLSLYIQYQYI